MDNSLEKITENTKIWTPDLDVTLPIDGRDIHGFIKWVNWNGYSKENDHQGFDFAAYLAQDGSCILGLPKETPVRAVADGVVSSIGRPDLYGYFRNITIRHSRLIGGLESRYFHIVPSVEIGRPVKKGNIIATLYEDERDYSGKGKRLVHLHIELISRASQYTDPAFIFHELNDLVAEPQCSKNFRILQDNQQPTIRLANPENRWFSN